MARNDTEKVERQTEMLEMEPEIESNHANKSAKNTTAVEAKYGHNLSLFANKKTAASGMLDIALLSANVSQFKYVMQIGEKHEFYRLMMGMLVMSIILQIGIGIGLVVIEKLNTITSDKTKYNIGDTVLTAAILFVTVLNIIMSGFAMKQSDDAHSKHDHYEDYEDYE